MEKLKPCPFCGGNVKQIETGFGVAQLVTCEQCKIMFVIPWSKAENGHKLFKFWNRRTPNTVKKHPQYINRDLCGAFVTVCPSCERELADDGEQENFCPSCGQALDWSVIEGLDDN